MQKKRGREKGKRKGEEKRGREKRKRKEEEIRGRDNQSCGQSHAFLLDHYNSKDVVLVINLIPSKVANIKLTIIVKIIDKSSFSLFTILNALFLRNFH